MGTLYLRNVPDDVVRRLQRLADRDGATVSAVAVRELSDVSRRADGPEMTGDLPDLGVDASSIVEGLEQDRAQRHDAIRAEVAGEEAEAAEAEAVEKAAALDVPMHLRIDRRLDQQLRQRASEEHIPTSALVRRLLRQAVQQGPPGVSVAEVEGIARRVAREELQNH
ncbi:hypothetical protein MF406_05030 [Georgenia sp. TF02-10]|uniref:hypothetical protein n=1 Tax=Georgenia sp. TF02-10 TaxID=2917725 RepID=UPI001FA6BE66|nr:hypothetical protein [Georgenia sp. TF02-10]UNX55624.1 hypothetical protein MF406_05030 [Georgenia sp. TF02-10]